MYNHAMTTLNTIIEEEEKKFLELFGERGNITNGERYTFKMGTTPQHILNHLTTAIQRAYEAGGEEERERIENELDKHIAPHPLSLEDSVWLKRLLNKVFRHEN